MAGILPIRRETPNNGYFNFCTSCHMNIISKECVKCPKGKPYHRLCLLQRNINQHVNEEMDYNYPVYSVKMEGVNEETQNELFKQTYAPLLFHKKSVRLFSMSDDEFYL
ncbi:uncharacterized protein LOC111127350 isoform X2 [Crassostrea virginica]|uniref:Uncharacterized protein LOC111127350 isoform X2 n=1 Tax=Crassostrea virginica TaxID=6565 RepID=A0A8B8DKR7_CRAVI|nr:uncharacterized protein LOC111127350 isoform X2 [Crassostrea virginica]